MRILPGENSFTQLTTPTALQARAFELLQVTAVAKAAPAFNARNPVVTRKTDPGGPITDALFDVELEFQVVISTLVVCEEDWERGPYQVLPIRDEIERYGVAA